jgi:hypothetical protein
MKMKAYQPKKAASGINKTAKMTIPANQNRHVKNRKKTLAKASMVSAGGNGWLIKRRLAKCNQQYESWPVSKAKIYSMA